MAIPRARSIEDLYEAVRDYDLVLTTDGPLSLALNPRLDKPYLGHFATTPRMLASGEFRPRDDRSVVSSDTVHVSWYSPTMAVPT